MEHTKNCLAEKGSDCIRHLRLYSNHEKQKKRISALQGLTQREGQRQTCGNAIG